DGTQDGRAPSGRQSSAVRERLGQLRQLGCCRQSAANWGVAGAPRGAGHLLKCGERHAANDHSPQRSTAGSAVRVRRQHMPATVRRLTRSRPGKMTTIDYSLIAVLTAYGVL